LSLLTAPYPPTEKRHQPERSPPNAIPMWLDSPSPAERARRIRIIFASSAGQCPNNNPGQVFPRSNPLGFFDTT
jgi:hypothetical protein